MTTMEQLFLWMETYGIPAVLLLIALEYACFPISSELVLPFAGAVGAGNGIAFPLLVAYSTVAGLAGTSLIYAIGRYGGSPLLEKVMSRFPSSQKPILRSYRIFGNHGRSAVCFGRFLPICRTYIAFVAGACGQSYPAYVFYSAIGISVWNTILLTLGYYFYQFRHTFFLYFNQYKTVVFVAGLLFLILLLVRNVQKDDETPFST
jgi:membrane protein DedA with SNARE-associated domain